MAKAEQRSPFGPVPLQNLHPCRVGGGGAFALPPSARSNGSCSFPASRFPVWTPRGRQEHSDARHQADQTYESQFRHQPSGRILAISGVPPSLGDERPQPAFDPPVQLMKELADIRLPVVVPPAADDRVDSPDHFAQPHGRLSSCQVPYLVFEPVHRSHSPEEWHTNRAGLGGPLVGG